MSSHDEDYALFGLDEVPQVKQHTPVPVIEVEMSFWTSRSGVSKKSAHSAIHAIYELVNEDSVALEDVKKVFSRPTLLGKAKIVTKDEIANALRLLPFDEQAEKMLAKWGSRTTVSKVSLENSIHALASVLAQDAADVDDIKYALSHRTLLASAKRLTVEKILDTVGLVAQDKSAGQFARVCFEQWYEAYGKDKTVQNSSYVISVIKKAALLPDVDRELLKDAVLLLGRDEGPVTEASLQYALLRTKKNNERRANAGMNAELFDRSDDILKDTLFGDHEHGSKQEGWNTTWI